MLIQLRLRTSPHWFLPSEISSLRKARSFRLSTAPFCPFVPLSTFGSRIPPFTGRERSKFQVKGIRKIENIEACEAEGELNKGEGGEISSGGGNDNFGGDFKGVDEEFANASAYRGRRDEKDFDKDPEIADILGNCFDDPKKAQSKVEERIRKKRSKIVQTKTGSATPMKVRFNKFNFSNSYIWIEFYMAPLPQDVTLICDTVRAWHIIGRLGGCNSMNMQLSQSAMDNKRPRYDAIQGANVTPTTFYNIGDLELQDNLARIWVDIGTSEPLLLDLLVNALSSISSDYVGIKQVIFGGSEFQSWKESLVSEEAGCSTHRI